MIYQTTISATIVLAVLLFMVPRKYFLLPFILGACFLPADQRIIIADLDLTVLRILVVAGVLRMWVRGELISINWNRFDCLVLLWVTIGAAIYVIQWGDLRALIYKCGIMFDVIGLYWLFRQNIRSWHDIVLPFIVLAVCATLLVPLVAFEWATGQNPFVTLGTVGTAVREGRYRCQASFSHSIMLGLFWATLMPLFIGLAITGRRKKFYWTAVAASIFLICASASSTPIGTLVSIILLLPLFRFRRYGQWIAWGFCGIAVTFHLIMKAPVWHLISRVNIINGSTGWHRYHLIDQTIKHFGEWALLGTRGTAHWGRGLGDITNQYVAEGVNGGFLTLALFIYLLIVAVKVTGSYSLQLLHRDKQWLTWCICVSVLCHCISFFGVAYFGQIRMLLYLTFAIVAAIQEMSNSVRNVDQAKVL